MLGHHCSAAIDHEGLGHAVNAPFDRSAPLSVCPHGRERVAIMAKEPARRGRLIFVIDAIEHDTGAVLQLDQQRMLLDAGCAPRGPEIHHRYRSAAQVPRTEAWDRLAAV